MRVLTPLAPLSQSSRFRLVVALCSVTRGHRTLSVHSLTGTPTQCRETVGTCNSTLRPYVPMGILLPVLAPRLEFWDPKWSLMRLPGFVFLGKFYLVGAVMIFIPRAFKLTVTSGYVCASWTRVGSTTDGEATGTGVAPYVQIRWVESDLSVLETHPLTPGLHLQATEAAFITSTITVAEPTSEKTPVDEDGSSGLSKSAKAGIAVGVSVSLLLYIMAAVLIWRCCRKRQEEKDDSSRAVVTSASPATGQVQQYQGPQEMGYKVVHQPASELATDPIRHQADSQPRAELPGSIEDRPNTVNELATSADVIPKSQAQSPGVVARNFPRLFHQSGGTCADKSN